MTVNFVSSGKPALGHGNAQEHLEFNETSFVYTAPIFREAPKLPQDIAFLVGFGISPEILLRAQILAKKDGVFAHEAGLAHGLFSAEHFYQSLARHCGVSFCAGPVEFGDTAQYPKLIFDGIAEIKAQPNLKWLLAPRAEQLGMVLANRHAMRNAGNFTMTTPEHFSKMAQSHFQSRILSLASHDLPRLHPNLSAHRLPIKPNQLLMFWCLTLGVAVVFVAFPNFAFALISIILGGVFLGAVWLRLAACLASPNTYPKSEIKIEAQNLPRYSVIVAMKDEAKVVARLVASLQALNYPASRLQIILVLEHADSATRDALALLNLPPPFEVLIAPCGQPRTKPRALNIALPLVRGKFVVVFDAEDQPQSNQLRDALNTFADAPPNIACLQAHLAVENKTDSWLSKLFAIEYAALFDVVNPGLCQLGLPLPLGGSSNHFKTSALRQVMGWDAWNVTEDADLGLRLARLGFAVETFKSTTLEEAPITLAIWLGQRSRWQKGWMQTACVHLSRPRDLVQDLGFAKAAGISTILGAMVMGPLLGPFLFAVLVYDVFQGPFLNPTSNLQILCSAIASLLFISGVLATLIPAILGVYRRNLWSIAPVLCLLPVYYLLSTSAAWRAFWEYFVRPFHWQKTDHGFMRGDKACGMPPK